MADLEDVVGDDVELLLLLALHVDAALQARQVRDAGTPHQVRDRLARNLQGTSQGPASLSEWHIYHS